MDMDMRQILILTLLVVPVWPSDSMPRCYEDHELNKAAERKLRSHYPQPIDPLPADTPDSCPVDLYRHAQPTHVKDRSLSPWRYVVVKKEDHFPSTYTEAKCLCSGCILIQDYSGPVESPDFNSVEVKQSRVFLKKELCSDGKKYSLKPVSVEVVVGCTCARPRY
ncbi:uncharacterized protein V6R79_025896 [Siganus canaliculatus]